MLLVIDMAISPCVRDARNTNRRRYLGEFMATATGSAPSREDFAAMLDESFGSGNLQEGSVIKGTIVGIEKDMAIIDVGLKMEGRVALREFSGPGRPGRTQGRRRS